MQVGQNFVCLIDFQYTYIGVDRGSWQTRWPLHVFVSSWRFFFLVFSSSYLAVQYFYFPFCDFVVLFPLVVLS